MIKNLIFLGAPGVGKGTAASLLSKKTNLVHLSTGEIFRSAIREKTKLGLELKSIVENGFYVPDEITNAIVQEKIDELYTKNINFILDGYPRTVNQANFLENLKSANIDKVILLEAPKDIIIQRLTKRRYCPVCSTTYHLDFKPSAKGELCEKDDTKLLQREDDKEEAIMKRLEVYNSETKILISFYEEKGMLVKLSAVSSPEEIVNNILQELEK
ncbi:adenylate kinase family protein [Mesomycoplasma lagogenitalium]|uniref:Adenylate kinase n=1 Tax=Mesomycoplasma lagogenitalium TaxID=171286 RepID=A0ABY8LVL1_9BACT|nr:nucleoside monophosphate kinase [Mesomycoplasma lagogenitalium]WGI36568.1 nucleoside monophosphate kinase [Mesomycoplasma lagogenitalium]